MLPEGACPSTCNIRPVHMVVAAYGSTLNGQLHSDIVVDWMGLCSWSGRLSGVDGAWEAEVLWKGVRRMEGCWNRIGAMVTGI